MGVGLLKGIGASALIVAGIAAVAATGGTALPVVVGSMSSTAIMWATQILGLASVMFGVNDLREAAQDLIYPLISPQTPSDNILRDHVFAFFGVSPDEYYLIEAMVGGAAAAGAQVVSSFGLAGGAVGINEWLLGNSYEDIKQVIHNRYPNEIQVGREIGYTIKDGKIYVDNGVQNVDFVIDMDGNLHIGSGHSYLANGADVQAAGTLKINNQGYVRAITNASGHYTPTVEQGRAFPDLLNSLGIRTKNAWLELGNYTFTSSGYVDLKNSTKIVEKLKY